MIRSHRPGEQLEPGQAAAESATASAQVAAPVLLSGSLSQSDSTDASCASPRNLKDGTPTGETEDAAALLRPGDAVAASRHVRARKELARPLLSSSPDGHHAPDDNPYMPLATLSRYSGLSVRTLRAALRDPLHPLPHYRPHAGGKVLVRRSEFDAWMSQFRADSTDVDAIVREVLDDVG